VGEWVGVWGEVGAGGRRGVASSPPITKQRLAFSGWWTSTNIPEANSIEDASNDDERHSQLSPTIDGTDGSVVDYTTSYERLNGLWVEPLQ